MKFHNFSLNRVIFFENEKEEKNSRPGEIIYIYIFILFFVTLDKWLIRASNWSLLVA